MKTAEQTVALPDGVSEEDWERERAEVLDPRLQAFLDCVRLLDQGYDSDYAIMHCSPERFQDCWGVVRQVTRIVRGRIAPLLDLPSSFAEVEEARLCGLDGLRMLSKTVLNKFDELPEVPEEGQEGEARRTLCITIGELSTYLEEVFCQLMAADPRNLEESDYFLSSRSFVRNLDESAWLYSAVEHLQGFVRSLGNARVMQLSALIQRIEDEETLPGIESWRGTREFLEELVGKLVPKLEGVRSMKGIRVDELESVGRYAHRISTFCSVLLAIYDVGRTLIERTEANLERSPWGSREGGEALMTQHYVLSRRLAELMRELENDLKDLDSFLPLWLSGLGNRRGLVFRAESQAPPRAVQLRRRLSDREMGMPGEGREGSGC